MFKKLTILAASCIMTVGVVAAAAPPVSNPNDGKTTIALYMAQGCRQSYQDYLNDVDTLQAYINKVPEELRDQMYSTCVGYQLGYIDGSGVLDA